MRFGFDPKRGQRPLFFFCIYRYILYSAHAPTSATRPSTRATRAICWWSMRPRTWSRALCASWWAGRAPRIPTSAPGCWCAATHQPAVTACGWSKCSGHGWTLCTQTLRCLARFVGSLRSQAWTWSWPVGSRTTTTASWSYLSRVLLSRPVSVTTSSWTPSTSASCRRCQSHCVARCCMAISQPARRMLSGRSFPANGSSWHSSAGKSGPSIPSASPAWVWILLAEARTTPWSRCVRTGTTIPWKPIPATKWSLAPMCAARWSSWSAMPGAQCMWTWSGLVPVLSTICRRTSTRAPSRSMRLPAPVMPPTGQVISNSSTSVRACGGSSATCLTLPMVARSRCSAIPGWNRSCVPRATGPRPTASRSRQRRTSSNGWADPQITPTRSSWRQNAHQSPHTMATSTHLRGQSEAHKAKAIAIFDAIG